jgi:hypothetical protein
MDTNTENKIIEIDQETIKNLNTTRKWSMFIAIVGFIFLGLMIILGVITGTFLTAFKSGETGIGIPESLILVIVALSALIYFFPVLFLYRFSKHLAHAVHTLDKQEIYKAFKYLKSYFVYLGILLIVVLSFYVVALIVTGSSLSLLKGM